MKSVSIFPSPQDIEFSVNEYFVGRRRELSFIETAFKGGKQAVEIYGGPGTGKTSLALMFAELNKTKFPGGIFHTYAYLPESVEHLLSRAIPSPPLEPALLVFDEAEGLDDQDRHHLRNRLQTMHQLKVIVIGRQPLGLFGDDVVVSLDTFTKDEVKQLLEKHLTSVSPENAKRLYEMLQGNPSLTDMAGVSLRQRLATWNDLFTKLHDFQYAGIVGPDGHPLDKDSEEHNRIVVDVSKANDELFRALKDDPSLMRSLAPRKFEKMVAELLGKQGYTVTMTPVSKDGGFDMYAAKKDGLGTFLYLVECKRYTPPNKVGVGVARSLYGVLQSRKATAGVIVTTSFFTKGAKDFQKENFCQLQLHDYIDIQGWLKKYTG